MPMIYDPDNLRVKDSKEKYEEGSLTWPELRRERLASPEDGVTNQYSRGLLAYLSG